MLKLISNAGGGFFDPRIFLPAATNSAFNLGTTCAKFFGAAFRIGGSIKGSIRAEAHLNGIFMSNQDNLRIDGNLTAAQAILRNLWEEHVRYEFSTRNTGDTLATMVDDAYVNHIPVLTGGSGRDEFLLINQ